MHSTPNERVTIFIHPDLNTSLRVEAATKRQSISDVVAEALREHLKTTKK